MTTNNVNPAEEKLAFEIFLSLYKNLPAGEKSEAPDFKINHHGKIIGVELIELMENSTHPVPSTAKYSLEDKIAKSAQRQYDQISNKKIMVNLQMVENLNIPQNKIDYLASQIADILTNTLIDKPNILSHHLGINENLPKEILNIYYDITPFLPESHFSVMRGKWTGSFNLNDLNRAIEKKEKNIQSYLNNVDLIYLLIIEGFTFSSYLGPFERRGNIIINNFDKIFLLKVMSRELFEIK